VRNVVCDEVGSGVDISRGVVTVERDVVELKTGEFVTWWGGAPPGFSRTQDLVGERQGDAE
jgi:hypothetical protein